MATLGPTTPWAGKHVTYEDGRFCLEGVGVLTVENILTYDRSGYLIWAREDLSDWVRGMAAGATEASTKTGAQRPESEKRRSRLRKTTVVAIGLVGICVIAAAWVALGRGHDGATESSSKTVAWRDASAGGGLLISYDTSRFKVKSPTASPGTVQGVELESKTDGGGATLSVSVNDMGSSFSTNSLIKMVTGIVSKTKKVAGSAGRVSPYSVVDVPALDATGLSFDAVVPTSTNQLHMRATYLTKAGTVITILAESDVDSWGKWQGPLAQMTASLRSPDEGSTGSQLTAIARTSQCPVKLAAFADVANETVAFVGSNSTKGGRVYVQDPNLLRTYPVSSASAYAGMPATSSRYVVWMQAPNSESRNYDIWAYDLSQGVAFPLTSDAAWEGQPDVAGDWVVWVGSDNESSGIYAYRLSDKSTTKIANSTETITSPNTDGRWVVWQTEPRNGGPAAESNIMGYDLQTGKGMTICSAPGSQVYPSVSDGYVVWKDFRNGEDNPDIYGYDLASRKEFVVSDAPGEQSEPAITDGKVLYRSAGSDSGSSVLMGYDIASGVISRAYASADSPGFCKAGEGSFVFSTNSYGGPTILRMGFWR